mmetsp:Transcript_22967/g.41367  ORF Transcript_22967/g.41367 Transcript_22967/m.41367 type:complete len:332 (-) Transcript_22967:213-1208(-)
MDFCKDNMRKIQHKVRESIRYTKLLNLEKRRPRQYRGIAGAVRRPMVAAALRNFSTEEGLQAARQVLVGAVWTKARAYARKKLVESPICDYCKEETEDEEHIFWRCKAWDLARHPWINLVAKAAAKVSHLRGKPIMEWPPCITQACIPPAWMEKANNAMAQGEEEKNLIEILLLQYVGILMMRKHHEIKQTWMQPNKSEVHLYPFYQLFGPLPCRLVPKATFRTLTPSQWKWSERFRLNLISWLNELQWIDAPGQVTFLELVMDFEAFSRKPIPPAPEARYEKTGTLPLAERGRVLRMSIAALQPLMMEGEAVPAKAVKKCRSLVPLGGPQ